jgi:Undecaprenyl-phosphate glucose phosphotransferase
MSLESEVGQKNASGSFARPAFSFPFEVIPYLLSTADALIILVSGMTSGLLYHWVTGTPLPNLTAYFAVGLIASFVHIVRLGGRGYYDFEIASKPGVEIVEILVSWFTTGLALAFFAFLLKIGIEFSRGTFLIFLLSAPFGLLAQRKLTKVVLARAVARGSVGRRNTVLIGARAEMAALNPQDLLAFFGAADFTQFMLSDASDREQRCACDLATLNSVSDYVRKNNSVDVLLAVPWSDAARIEFLREQLKLLPVSAKLLPDGYVRALSNYAPSAGQRVLSVEIQRAPLSFAERAVKRGMDVVISALALAFLLPVMAFAAIGIKLDGRGPVIFRQNRKGFNGREFVMLKFRTMTVQDNGEVVRQATRDDPRVTRIGKLLRAASIDELPQLWNVVRGDMSLIGPRPHALAHDNYFEKVLSDYAFRHHVKPGITGWAQVHGLRGATPTVDHISNRVKMDLWYINNWSLWLDIQILFKTFFEVLSRRNAY